MLSAHIWPVRVALAAWDFVRTVALIEKRRVYDLLSLLAKVKLHGRRLTAAEAAPWNVLVEWRAAVAAAPAAVFIARADEADVKQLTRVRARPPSSRGGPATPRTRAGTRRRTR